MQKEMILEGQLFMGQYKTRQHTLILTYLKKQKGKAFTADAVFQELQQAGENVGKATVYRALERLVEDGAILKVPAAEGNRALYRCAVEQNCAENGQMVCLSCGRAFPLECSHLESLSQHIRKEHQFELDTRHTVLYGYCKNCIRLKHITV